MIEDDGVPVVELDAVSVSDGDGVAVREDDGVSVLDADGVAVDELDDVSDCDADDVRESEDDGVPLTELDCVSVDDDDGVPVVDGDGVPEVALLPVVERYLGLSADHGAAFLASYRDDVDAMWQRFAATIESWCSTAQRPVIPWPKGICMPAGSLASQPVDACREQYGPMNAAACSTLIDSLKGESA